MLLHDYLRILRRGWWLIAALGSAGALLGFGISLVLTPTYQARATVYVSTLGDASPADLQQGNVFATQRVTTYADLATTSAVLDRVIQQSDDGTGIEELRNSITSAARPETSLIDVFTTNSDPAEAARAANAVAQSLAQQVSTLDALPGATSSPVQVEVVEPAVEPSTAIAPLPRSNTLAGAVIGLLLGVGSVVGRNALDTRIRTLGDLPKVEGLATLTSIPSPATRGARATPRDEARTEAFRTLRSNLQFGSHIGGSLAVAPVATESDAREVSGRLARALGEIDYRVVVVDADLREPGPAGSKTPRQPGGESVPTPAGLADVLSGKSDIQGAVVAGTDENVFHLPSGDVASTSAQLISTPKMASVLAELKGKYDHVIVTCPPLTERSEAAVVCAVADSTLVVLQAGVTTRTQFLLALELLAGVRVTSASVAVDNVRDVDVTVTRWHTLADS